APGATRAGPAQTRPRPPGSRGAPAVARPLEKKGGTHSRTSGAAGAFSGFKHRTLIVPAPGWSLQLLLPMGWKNGKTRGNWAPLLALRRKVARKHAPAGSQSA